jgi:hypothetical protein
MSVSEYCGKARVINKALFHHAVKNSRESSYRDGIKGKSQNAVEFGGGEVSWLFSSLCEFLVFDCYSTKGDSVLAYVSLSGSRTISNVPFGSILDVCVGCRVLVLVVG